MACVFLILISACIRDQTQSPEYEELLGQVAAAEEAARQATERVEGAEQKAEQLQQTLDELNEEQLRLRTETEDLRQRLQQDESTILHRYLARADPFIRVCGTDVYGTLAEGWRDDAFVAGDLALVGLLGMADPFFSEGFEPRDGQYLGQKVLAVIEPGAVVTVVVPEAERQHLSLLYNPSNWTNNNLYSLSDGDGATTFVACTQERETQFNGAFIVAGARCAALDLYIGERLEPIRVTASFGAGDCH